MAAGRPGSGQAGKIEMTVATHFVSKSEFARARRVNAAAGDRAALFAALARINTLYMIKRAGSGHIGSSFSSLDIVSWLYLNELEEGRHVYFSSKGHDAPGLYAVLVGMGLLEQDKLHKLRRLDGLPGHPDIATPHMVANTGSLGMGISKAKGIAFANRQSGETQFIFVMTGDGELQEGQLWESLGQAANRGYGEIIAIVDHNKLQSDLFVSAVSDLGDLEAKFASFGWHVQRCSGHDFDALEQAIAAAKSETERPSVIIADTVKGSGVSFMEPTDHAGSDALYGFHSGAPSDADYKRARDELLERANRMMTDLGQAPIALAMAPALSPPMPPPSEPQSLPQAYAAALVAQGKANPDLVVLDADLMLDCGLIPFQKAFPERFIECGIAEQDMVSQAGAMALRGLLPVVHSFACFLTPRANEQIYNNATEGRRVIYSGFLAGLLPAGPGHSHQSVRDIGILSSTPGLTLIEPSCAEELAIALDYAVNENPSSTYLRFVSIPCDVGYAPPEDYAFERGCGWTLRDGVDATLIAYGPVMLPIALDVAEILAASGISLKVVNLPWLNVVDPEWLSRAVSDVAAVFTLDNHYLDGGQGERVAACLAETGLANGRRFERFGLTDIPACGRNDEVLAHHGLDAASLAKRIADGLKGV